MKPPFDTARSIIVFSLLICASRMVIAETSSSATTNPILGLMANLSEHTQSPDQVLDPLAEAVLRNKNLERLSDPHYELTLIPTGSIPVPDSGVASVPVRVHFKAEGTELEASATAHFIKRGNTWYFASFDFLAFPAFLIAVVILCCCVGISYATIVLVLRHRVVKRGEMSSTMMFRLFIPFFWPSLFRLISLATCNISHTSKWAEFGRLYRRYFTFKNLRHSRHGPGWRAVIWLTPKFRIGHNTAETCDDAHIVTFPEGIAFGTHRFKGWRDEG